ncbi:PCRF domain-containing protein [Nocardia huaxiensis]|uniref:PCRF domain-containing protein n=1 Tax=Nocardia huaxiensis TaxID=2755382 RepID=UPI001E2E96EA|nr:PCRF domain-containing protein [Nocardia huaxiensis]UFS99970.1 PCRF domain-containing protein [Nocardia huaxiensis]
MAGEEPSFATELPELKRRVEDLTAQLVALLVPADPHRRDNTFVDIWSDRDSEDSARFAGDLVTHYRRYAEHRGWTADMLDWAESEFFGYERVTLSISGRGGTWPAFRFESGLHRTLFYSMTGPLGSPATAVAEVLAYPEPAWRDRVTVNDADIRIDTYCPGLSCFGNRNPTTYLTHLPTGITASSSAAPSQYSNKRRALQLLASRLDALAENRCTTATFGRARPQCRTEPIRTYDYFTNRITDHRIDLTVPRVFEPGALDALVAALRRADPGA